MIYRISLILGVLSTFVLNSVLLADAGENVDTALVGVAGESPAAEEKAADVDPPAATEVSEEDLVKLIGYLSAQGAGISFLSLDAEQTEALIESFTMALLGERSIQDVDQVVIDTAMNEVRARFEAGTTGQEGVELPELSTETPGTLGLIIVDQTGLLDFGFSESDVDLILQGFRKGLADGEMSAEVQAMMPAFQGFMQEKIAEIQAKITQENVGKAEENKKAGLVYLETLRNSDPDVQRTESGLHFKILEPGGESLPEMSDRVLVHYRGTLIDGTQFDSSYDRGQPATFPLEGVVPGFGEGLTKIGEGGRIMLYIPSELGYGDSPRPGGAIKPGDTLVFECELLKINP